MSAVAVAVEPAAETTPQPIDALVALLDQLREVLTLIPVQAYIARPAARVSGSVGEHVRHCLDHVSALASAMAGEELSYDHRLRGTTVEVDPASAINEIERLFFRMNRVTVHSWDRPLRFHALVDATRASVGMRTTLVREAAFVIQHTIHHCAVIAVLLEWQGWRVPRDFGLAPATAKARAGAVSARADAP